MTHKIIRSIFILGLLLMTFRLSSAMGQFFFMENEMVGKPAPDFTLPVVGGGQMNFTQLRGDKGAIILFWATWCPHCRRELNNLKIHQEVIEGNGTRIVLVDTGEDEETIQEYLQKNKIDMTVLMDKDSAVAENYHILGVPTFYLVDKTGIVREIQHGLPEDLKAMF